MSISLSTVYHSNWLSNNGTCTASVTVPVGAKKLIIYGWTWFESSPVATVSAPVWDGVSAAQVGTPIVGNGYYCYVFAIDNPSALTGTLSWNPSATSKQRSFSCYSVNCDYILSANYASTTNLNTTPSITINSQSGDLSVYGLMYRGATTANITETGGQVTIGEDQTDFFAYRGISTETATGSTNTASWTNGGTNNRWGAVAANFMETVPAQLITDITDPIVFGSPITWEDSGFSSPVTTITAIGLSATSVNGTLKTAAWPALADGQVITVALPATNQTVTASNGSENATINTDFDLPAGHTAITFASAITDDDKFLGFHETLTDGFLGYYPTANGLVVGAAGDIACDGAFTFTMFLHKLGGDNSILQLNVTVTESGSLIVTSGLTSTGMTSIGLTSTGLTSVGL